MTAVQVVHLHCDEAGCLSEWVGRTHDEYVTRRKAAHALGWRRILRLTTIDDYCPVHAGSGSD